MDRRELLTAAAVAALGIRAVDAAPLRRSQIEESLVFVWSMHQEDGGFRPAPAAGLSTLGSVVAGTRATRYFKGALKSRETLAKFVQSCHAEAGGFADRPGLPPDLRSTAMGLMALKELDTPLAEIGKHFAAYFEREAKTAPEIYIAAAALHAAEIPPANPARWLEVYRATRTGEGTYGPTAGDSARAAVTFLRLGAELPERDALIANIKRAQTSEGGFRGAAGPDLVASYPCMRAMSLLKVRPDVDAMRRFVAACRGADHGYGSAPGQPSALSPTYYAAIISHWLDEFEA